MAVTYGIGLLVHAIVVLLPLAALVLAASALRPSIARRLAGPNAVLAVLVWWRSRESRHTGAQLTEGPGTATRAGRRTLLAPTSTAVGVVLAVLAVVTAVATFYDLYLIGDSGAVASRLGRFTP